MVGVVRILTVLPAESVKTMVFSVNEKEASWSLGASVISTGTSTAAEAMLLPASGEIAFEHPAIKLAASERPAAKVRKRVTSVVRNVVRRFMACSVFRGGNATPSAAIDVYRDVDYIVDKKRPPG